MKIIRKNSVTQDDLMVGLNSINHDILTGRSTRRRGGSSTSQLYSIFPWNNKWFERRRVSPARGNKRCRISFFPELLKTFLFGGYNAKKIKVSTMKRSHDGGTDEIGRADKEG